MELQRKIIIGSLCVVIVGFVVYTITFFINIDEQDPNVILWLNQIVLAIFTSSLVTSIVAVLSYKKMKKQFYATLGQNLRRLYNFVDDYLMVISDNDVYFEDYFILREEFLSINIIPEGDGVTLIKKDAQEYVDAMQRLYLRPMEMLYYSYREVRSLERKYLKDTNRKGLKKYVKELNNVLYELNEYLLELKDNDEFNVRAFAFYDKAGMRQTLVYSMDDFDSKYQKSFRNAEEDIIKNRYGSN